MYMCVCICLLLVTPVVGHPFLLLLTTLFHIIKDSEVNLVESSYEDFFFVDARGKFFPFCRSLLSFLFPFPFLCGDCQW